MRFLCAKYAKNKCGRGSTRTQLGELTVLDLWGLLIRGGRAEERRGDVKGRGGEKGRGRDEGRKGRERERVISVLLFPTSSLGLE